MKSEGTAKNGTKKEPTKTSNNYVHKTKHKTCKMLSSPNLWDVQTAIITEMRNVG